jgi:hypothetical protein
MRPGRKRLMLHDYRGRPFAHRSGDLMTFDAEVVSGDPFPRERLLERHSIKQLITDKRPSGDDVDHLAAVVVGPDESAER